MKKRHFLKMSLLAISTAWLSSTLLGTKKAMANSSQKFEVTKTEQEWRKILTPQQFYVLRQQGTERAYSSPLDKQYNKGLYVCAGCALPVFSSETKFNSGTGWPSFYAPIRGAVATSVDKSFLMTRTEVHCRRCGGHLGHVFNDGPPPTGKRYCMNGVALNFKAT
ncbi:peptide-methionine (R)-S-oxide reductase MsrB [Gloeothece verrucosa]|uniref:peptide-methionine (R)-S-oxide reductase n=1 Tax=Gloeothece verrucosa (strain PCC 7822) TaxID=497965 RepID=E0UI09_GLOV7|nr:methionine-R-sulfoxide reductase [Gloeothece verrucosa PCC 7822]